MKIDPIFGIGYDFPPMIINPYSFAGSPPGATLLLDTYAGGHAAYSVRLLRSAYSGPCLRVRRSSDNVETDIGFAAGWIDEAALVAHCGASNGFVRTWHDQTGNGHHQHQTNSTLQPKIVSAGVVVTDGARPALDFDLDRFLPTSYAAALPQPFTYLAVAKITDTARRGLMSGSTSTLTNRAEIDTNVTKYSAYAGSGLGGPALDANRHIIQTLFNASSSRHVVDESATTGNLGLGSPLGITIGTLFTLSFPWLGTIQEAIVFAADRSADEAAIAADINSVFAVY